MISLCFFHTVPSQRSLGWSDSTKHEPWPESMSTPRPDSSSAAVPSRFDRSSAQLTSADWNTADNEALFRVRKYWYRCSDFFFLNLLLGNGEKKIECNFMFLQVRVTCLHFVALNKAVQWDKHIPNKARKQEVSCL